MVDNHNYSLCSGGTLDGGMLIHPVYVEKVCSTEKQTYREDILGITELRSETL